MTERDFLMAKLTEARNELSVMEADPDAFSASSVTAKREYVAVIERMIADSAKLGKKLKEIVAAMRANMSEDATGDRLTALPLAGRPVSVGEGAGGVKNGSELLVEVRAGEIKKGRRKNCKLCPVALAVRRAAVSAGIMKEFYEGNEILMPWASVYVSHGWISFGGIGCKAPACVGRFIEAFDEGKRVRPFAFTLELPEANK